MASCDIAVLELAAIVNLSERGSGATSQGGEETMARAALARSFEGRFRHDVQMLSPSLV